MSRKDGKDNLSGGESAMVLVFIILGLFAYLVMVFIILGLFAYLVVVGILIAISNYFQ